MSEKLHSPHEIDLPKHEVAQRQSEIAKHHEKAAKEALHEHKKSMEKILEKIEQEASTTETIKHKHLDNDQHLSSGPITIGADLKKQSLNSGLKKIQSHLPIVERTFSKVIHNPVVNSLSEGTSKTIARPSGLLVGGLASVCVSLGVLFISQYYGYRYNFLVSILAFIGGFFLGLFLESMFQLFNRKASR